MLHARWLPAMQYLPSKHRQDQIQWAFRGSNAHQDILNLSLMPCPAQSSASRHRSVQLKRMQNFLKFWQRQHAWSVYSNDMLYGDSSFSFRGHVSNVMKEWWQVSKACTEIGNLRRYLAQRIWRISLFLDEISHHHSNICCCNQYPCHGCDDTQSVHDERWFKRMKKENSSMATIALRTEQTLPPQPWTVEPGTATQEQPWFATLCSSRPSIEAVRRYHFPPYHNSKSSSISSLSGKCWLVYDSDTLPSSVPDPSRYSFQNCGKEVEVGRIPRTIS